MYFNTVSIVWLLAALTSCINGQTNIFMDSPAYCGKSVSIFDRTYSIQARADVTPANPDYRCTVVIYSGYEDSYYQIQITQKMVDINDCGVKLSIYEGSSPGGASVKALSCTTKNTGVLYSKGGTITLELITPRVLYNPKNDFAIDVKAFRDPNAPAYESGGSRLAAGAIVGICLGIVIFLAFSIILCWCYRTRRLPGMQKYSKRPGTTAHSHNGFTNSEFNYSKEPSLASDAPSKKFYLENQGVFPSIDTLTTNSLNGSATNIHKKAQIANWNINTGRNEGQDYVNGPRGRYQSEADGRGRYQKAEQGRGRSQSTGSPERQRRGDNRPQNVPPPPPIGNLGSARNQRDLQNDKDSGMSGVQRRRQQRMNGSESDAKRPNSGIFENPDKEGYMYDYDQVQKLTSDEKPNEDNKMLHELKKELERRQSVKEGKGDGEKKETLIDDVPEKNTKSNDAPGAPKSNEKQTNEKPKLPETGTIDGKYRAMDEQSEIGDPDMISNPLIRNDPAIRASVSELRGSTSPGTRKKKRRKSHKKFVKADPVTGNTGYRTGDETSTERPTDMDESFDRDSIYNDSFRLPKIGQGKDLPLPPEAMAPIFATDESVMQHYYPPNQIDTQNQVYPILGYDALGNPVYGNPVPLSAAYAQPGYYVDANGYPINTQQQQQQPMQHQIPYQQQPFQYQSPEVHPGMPGYTSTPSNVLQTPHLKSSPHHGRKKRTKSTPHDALVASPAAPSPILPAGNILNETQLPAPGTTLMNSSVDPRTGVKTSQVVWTDNNPDPTDPTGGNPQITRQTVVRVTARDTEDGQLPNPPNAGLQHMTFNAARQLKSQTNAEPAFLSPSKPQAGPQVYTPGPRPVHAPQTPERDNAAFYTRVAPPEQNQLPSAPKPVVHNSTRNYSVRDQITLQPEESEF